MNKSFLEHAFDYVQKSEKPVSFFDMWAYVKEQANLSEEEAARKVSRFYTNLMLDGRFVTLGENTWDLRSRHKIEEIQIDMNNAYEDVETSEIDTEDSEQIEYVEALEGKKEDSDEFVDAEDGSEN